MKCGPDNCPIVTFSDLTPAEQRVQRKRIAKTMQDQGFTQAHIAKHLGVDQATISRALEEFDLCKTHKSKPAKTASNPKGAGRPKGSAKARPERRKNESVTAAAAAEQILNGRSYKAAEKDTGLSNTVLRSAVAREEGRREPQFTRDDLSPSAQQKFDIAVRRYRAQLEASFAEAVRVKYLADVAKYVNDVLILKTNEKIEVAQQLYRHRRGAMEKTTFNTIRRALHPDSRNSISDAKLAEAFDTFMSLEKFLLDEKDSPTHFDALPANLAEWDRMRAAATAARKAHRTNGSAVNPR